MKIYRRLPALVFCLCLPWTVLRADDDPAVVQHIAEQIGKLQAEKRARTDGQNKMASALIDAERVHRLGHASDTVATLESPLVLDGTGTELVDLSAEVSPALLTEIARMGGTVLHQHAQHHSIRARLPLSALETLAGHRDVHFIRPAALCHTNSGPIDSEGDVALGADAARAMFGVDGTGVKVGVLSDSVDKLSASQAKGELPNVNIIPGQSFIGTGGGEGEGTAMLEIVHDIAPGAELYFATAFISDTSFADNIRALADAGCSVIIDDVSYFNEPPFQDGVIAQAVNDVSAQGVLYFSAAGNSGSADQNTSGCWEGDFADGGHARVPGAPDARFHKFGSTMINRVKSGGSDYRVDLFWSDPLGAAGDDYDVYVVDARGNILRKSDTRQNGTGDPYESIGFVRPGEGIVIVKVHGNARFLHLETGSGILSIATSGVTRGHSAAAAANAFCVAAVDAEGLTSPFNSSDQTESFSSDGPRRIFYNPDGSPITPGNFSSTGGQVLQKPDITAADGVSTSVRFFESFFGTSAAAPHAGAVAALLKSFKPTITAAQIRTALQSTAIDIGAAGFDRDSGAGIINALDALNSVANVASQAPVVTTSGGSVSYTEGASAITVDGGVTITDADSTSFKAGSLTVDFSANGKSTDILAIRNQGFGPGQIGVAGNTVAYGETPIGTVSGGIGGSALAVSFTSFVATPAVVTTLARNVTFRSTSGDPSAAQRTVRFVAKDGDGDTSSPATKAVAVLPVNNAPSFTKGPDQVLVNDSGPQSIPHWATNISAGTPDEAAQNLTFLVTNDNSTLFATEPSIAANGTLTYRAANDAAGSTTVTVVLMDDGGTANGGVDTSTSQTFRIFINAGNIPPSFIAGTDVLVPVNSGTTVIMNWAKQITAGPANESTQQVNFLVTTDHDSLFSTLPNINSGGTLVFAPQPNTSGIAHITVRAHDNGGTADGGLDTSDPQFFIIAVSTFAEEVGNYNGLIQPAGGTPHEFARYGLARASVTRTGGFSARFTLGGQTLGVKGQVDGTGLVTFGRLGVPLVVLPRPGQLPLTLAQMHLDTTFGSDQLSGTFLNNGVPFANLLADRAAYSQLHPAPSTVAGKYTSLFVARDPLAQNLDADLFPQGDGFALVTVGNTGGVTFNGALADGSHVGFGSALSKTGTVPFHVVTDKRHGSLTTLVTFRDRPNVSDFDGVGATWFKPLNNGRVYPGGWPNGIAVDLLGSLLVVPPGQALLPGVLAPTTAGNAQIEFADAGLRSAVFKLLNIDAHNRVRVIGHDVDHLALGLNAGTGAITGGFIDPAHRTPTTIRGVVFLKQGLGSGFFLDQAQSGSLRLTPQSP